MIMNLNYFFGLICAEQQYGKTNPGVIVINKSLFSSASDEWSTPQDFFDKYNAIYNFDLDVCATPENAKCQKYFTEKEDGLSQKWTGVCWMNPPYGREIALWMKTALWASIHEGVTVVCLVPARTDTKWWHDYAMKGEIEFIRGRLKFGGHKNSAPFPSAVVTFRPTPNHRPGYIATGFVDVHNMRLDLLEEV